MNEKYGCSKKKYYTAFGFSIESDFDFGSLQAIESTDPDITINRGTIPDIFQNPVDSGSTQLYQYSVNAAGDIVVDMFKVAKYFISKGNTLIIDAHFPVNFNELQLFLFGSIFSALFYQRGLFPFHGSAVAKNGKSIIFTGESTAGKSTFAKIFLRNGYEFLTDDVCLIEKRDEELVMRPGIAELSLREDVVNHFQIDPGNLNHKGYKADKFGYAVKNCKSNFLPVRDILEIIPGDKLSICRLTGINKVKSMINNSYRIENIIGFNLYGKHLKFFSEVGNKIDYYQIERPSGQIVGDELVKFIESKLRLRL